MEPSLTITFMFERHREDPDKPFFSINVEYQPSKRVTHRDYVKVAHLPTELSYMVYYIREFLKVHLSRSDGTFQYIGLGFPDNAKHGRVIFLNKMRKLRY